MNYKFDTLAVHAGYTPDAENHCATAPISLTNAYTFDSTEQAKDLFELKTSGNIYTRLQNPTNTILEERISALEGGVAAVSFSSGHAAITCALLNLCQAGDEIVSSTQIYGGAINLLGVTLGNLGIKTVFVDPDDFDAWENAVTDRTKVFFAETVGNPNANVADISRIADIAHKHGIPLIIDSTFAPPCLCRPIEFGADFVIHSSTKFIGGHGNVMGGIVVDSGKFDFNNPRFPQYTNPDPSYHGVVFAKDFGNAGFANRLRSLILRDIGSCASPFNSYMLIQGIETLSLRMEKHCKNALTIAQYLEKHPQVSFVNYPSLPSSPYYSLAQKYLPKGAGSVFTFGVKGGRKAGAKFINSLNLFMHLANVGDVRSLVIHPATTTHSQLSDEQLKASGISADTIRLSVGIEDAEDLINDLEQALEASKNA